MDERIDKHGQRYLSGRLALLRLFVVRTEKASEGDPVWEPVLVEGQHIKACCEPVLSDPAPFVLGAG
jgi:hypothetical protein